MASIWEIFDPSNLVYDSNNSAAFEALEDQGSGPPTATYGWVRTGLMKGSANCDAYTSDVGTGTVAMLYPGPDSVVNQYGPALQVIRNFSCDSSMWVWCVSDP